MNVNLVGSDVIKDENHGKKEEERELEKSVKKLWDLETVGIREENEVHEALKDNISFDGERYKVGLPWKEGHDKLPSNYWNSLKRLKGQVNKLRQEPEILQECDRIIKEQLDRGIIERVFELEKSDKIHYLPNHPVVRREAKTTKVRMVFDASSKEKGGVSLNDCLHVGPALTPLLFDILIRFREKSIALVGDIEKAFLNVEVEERDRDCLRFLWVEDINSKEIQPVEYKICRVPFGVNSSPFLLNATVQFHLDKFQNVDPEFVGIMKRSLFVDDLVGGSQTPEGTLKLYDLAKSRMAEGGFRLRKWLTNDNEVKEKIAECERNGDSMREIGDDETYAKVSLGNVQKDPAMEKVLGIQWKCETDQFVFGFENIVAKCEALIPTKRNILSILASLYDPLGIVSPIVVSLKVLFQQLCVEKRAWDEEINGDERKQWEVWVRQLKRVQQISIPRCVHGMKSESAKYSLHGFADASLKAYCAVIYFVCESPEGVTVTLLASKTRVAPVKTQTIPRLELMAGRTLALLMDTVKRALETELELDYVRMWTDSKTVLSWINNKGEWKQFVRHRVNEILKITRKSDWGYCKSEENPADIGSRGVGAFELSEAKLWWDGPEWLQSKEWPKKPENLETVETHEEEKKSVVLIASEKVSASVGKVMNVEAFSSIQHLYRVTAWVKRFVSNLKAKQRGVLVTKGELTRDEIVNAERLWILEVQGKLKEQDNYKVLAKDLQIVEYNKLLKCKGRLGNSDLCFDARQPIIIPRQHHLTKLIVEDCHRRVHHSGLRSTLAEVRSKFWVPRGRQTVKNILRDCIVCKRVQGKAFETPPVADLPDFRVNEAPAFANVGVDFAGPLYVKERKGVMKKVYIVIFACCVTRAVHLELVPDMTVQVFLNCLRRFAARRGTPSLIVSDNAKTFKAAKILLKNLYKDQGFRGYIAQQGITWRFNLSKAPWWGSSYERMIGTMKRCLRKVLSNARMTFEELQTILVEVEGTLNSRPLTYEYDEVGSEVLTPAHLICGRRLLSIPDHAVEDDVTDSKLLKRFRYLARKKEHFWNRWRREYLADLREYQKGTKQINGRVVKVGEPVLVYEEHVSRCNWKVGVVEKLIVGKDGHARGAKVRLVAKGKPVYLDRPVQKLYPLEIEAKQVKAGNEVSMEENHNQIEETIQSPEVVRDRPARRVAALDSGWKTRAMLEP